MTVWRRFAQGAAGLCTASAVMLAVFLLPANAQQTPPAQTTAPNADISPQIAKATELARAWKYNDAAALADEIAATFKARLGAESPEYADALFNAAALLISDRRNDDAKPRYREALAIYEKRAASEPADPRWQRAIISTAFRLLRLSEAPAENIAKALAAVKHLEDAGQLHAWEKAWPAELERMLRQVAVDIHYTAGQFAEAHAMAELWIEAVKRVDDADGDTTSFFATVRAHNIAAFIALLARKPEAALAACDKALQLAPGDLWASLNRAHALMFLGRADEARDAYKLHLGATIPQVGPWEAAGDMDFMAFRRNSLDHPQMAEIERIFAVETKPELIAGLHRENAKIMWPVRLPDLGKWLSRYLDAAQARFGEDSVEFADAMMAVAAFGASGMVERAHAIYTRLLPADDPRVVDGMATEAIRLGSTGKLAESEAMWLTLIEFCDKTPRLDRSIIKLLDSATSRLASTYHQLGRRSEVSQLWRRTLQIVETKWGIDHPYVGRILVNGVFSDDMAERKKVEERVNAIFRKELKSPAPLIEVGLYDLNLNTSLQRLARQLVQEQQPEDAEKLFKLITRSTKNDRISFDATMKFYTSMGRFDTADEACRQFLREEDDDLRKRLPSSTQQTYARTIKAASDNYFAIAKYFRSRKNDTEAAVAEKRGMTALARAIFESDLSPFTMADALTTLADAYIERGQTANAIAALEQAVVIENTHWLEYLKTPTELRMKIAALGKGQPGGSGFDIPQFESRKEQAEKNLKCGAFEVDILAALDNWEASKADLSKRCSVKDLIDLERYAAPQFPRTEKQSLDAVIRIAKTYFDRKDWLNAMRLYGRAAEAMQRLRARPSKLAVQEKEPPGRYANFDDENKFLVAAYNARGLVPDQADAISEKAFALAQQSSFTTAAQALLQMAAREAKGTSRLAELVRERQALADEWGAIDRSLSNAVSKTGGGRDLAADRAQFERSKTVNARIEVIDRAIATEFPDYSALTHPAPLTLARTKELLRPNQALVFLQPVSSIGKGDWVYVWALTRDEARWVGIELETKRDTMPGHYGRLGDWTRNIRCGVDPTTWEKGTQAHQDCQFYDARRTASRVYHTAAGRSGGDRAFLYRNMETADTEKFDPQFAYQFYRAIFGPVDDLIRDKELLIVPAGELLQMPFHVLITDEPDPTLTGLAALKAARWLIRRQPVTILPAVSSLEIARRMKRSEASRPLIGFGNPMLDGMPNDTRQIELARSAREKQTCSPTTFAATNGRQMLAALPLVGSFFRGGLADISTLRVQSPLPETADELCQIARKLQVPASDIWLGDRMTETAIKEMSEKGELRRYRVLHFATHGLIAGNMNDLVEPALMFTPPATATERDDGLLTSSEVAQLKLDADWLVMSACNTAAANAKGAEPLSGLARAFFYAGARSLLVSHWEVYSSAAVDLTTRAFNETATDKTISRAEALRRAMVALIDKGGMNAHPTMWAPFALIGTEALD